MTASTVSLRAALYLRVSTARQAEHDVSIPDQKRQGEAYCEARGLQLVETFIEPGASATNAVFRQPEIIAGTWKAARPQGDGITEADARAALQKLDLLIFTQN